MPNLNDIMWMIPGQIDEPAVGNMNIEQEMPEMAPPIDMEAVKDYVIACKKESENAYVEKRDHWSKIWDLVQAKNPSTGKEDWQANIFVPELGPSIKKAVSLIEAHPA